MAATRRSQGKGKRGGSTPAPRGRPSLYTPEIAAYICEKLAEGQSLKSICQPDDMPAESTVRRWAVEDVEGFAAPYARAREVQVMKYADELLDIADSDGDPQSVRLRVDTRKWLLSKILPKQYGDRSELALTGDEAKPLTVRVVRS